MGVILLSLLLASVTLPLLTKASSNSAARAPLDGRAQRARRRRRGGHRAAGKGV